MTSSIAPDFYENLPPVARFVDALDPERAQPLPADWFVGTADVVSSTKAIAEGRYKAVNMVGASVISAVRNALGGKNFPFVFGGDGAGFAIAPEFHDVVAEQLQACPVWAREEIGLELRVAMVPVRDIRDADADVRVVRHAPAPAVSYAMISGGGMAWAETRMKQGAYTLEEARPGTRPDLTGLSCRWAPIQAERGEILSLIIAPQEGVAESEFNQVLSDVLQLLRESSANGGRPMPEEGPPFAFASAGLDYEARAVAHARDYRKTLLRLQMVSAFAWFLGKTGLNFRGFDAAHYRAQTARNTDFRKLDDGLKLTVDCSSALSRRIGEILEAARSKGLCHYGMHHQQSALMTCIVPSPFDDDHMHFIDGGAGGYAKAAEMLKQQLAAA